MRTQYRTHSCGALRAEHVGERVTLCGWTNVVRDQGGVLFVDLRDRYGLTQVTFRGDKDADLLAAAQPIRTEWVLQVEGEVIARPAEAVNPEMATGEIELEATKLTVLSSAQTPPFPLAERTEVSPEVRLRHRYLDLRRRRATEILGARAQICSTIRRYLDEHGFLDVETPTLVCSTPEGARDYLVPSRLRPGSFYALPQSPQLLKQLLMVGGQDRYYQFARCWRDEDLRADRQPEFTQVDLEASFVGEEDIYALFEPLVQELIKTWRGNDVATPFERLTYAECMARFGSDKPDRRNPLELVDVAEAAAAIDFVPFNAARDAGGLVKVLVAPGGATLSRKQIEAFEGEAKSMGAPGLAWTKWGEEKPTGPLARFLGGDTGHAFLEATGAKVGDLVLVAAGDAALVHRVLGRLRDVVAQQMGLVDNDADAVLWVTEFPLVEDWDEETRRFDPKHHPFTNILESDVELLLGAGDPATDLEARTALGNLTSRAYDLVLNGHEVGGGSIRIHRQDVQQAVFRMLGMGAAEVERRFGWFVDALQFGTPPHGGIALGLDRLVMCLLGESNIQDVIAFPKTLAASDLMMGAPGGVDPDQLEELRIRSVAEAAEEA